jgi:hypothetical protein
MKQLLAIRGLAEETGIPPARSARHKLRGKLPFFKAGHRALRFDAAKMRAAPDKFERQAVA